MRADELVMIVPSRGRPQAVEPLISAWDDTAAQATLLFVCDDDDPDLRGYETVIGVIDHPLVDLHVGPRRRLAGSLNEAVGLAQHRYAAVGFMGDDHRPRTVGWDARFTECLSGGAGIVYGNDLLVGDRFPTAVAMTSDIPRALGYMCPPHFVHLCLDLVWKDWGDGMGRITYLHDVVIEHLHPAIGKAELDERYIEVNSQEMVSADSITYYAYRDAGALAADIVALKELL